ncbi:MAG: C40 family peptidase [Armatimonadetes bacterium]|nr:C40 family peptidase [Armatimonadota bacterium]
MPLFDGFTDQQNPTAFGGRKAGTDVPTGETQVAPGTYGTRPAYPPAGTVYDPVNNQSVRSDSPSVYNDLDPTHLYIKDQLAGTVVRDRNIDYYFNKENIGKTAEQMEREEKDRRDQNAQLQQLSTGLSQLLSVPQFDDTAMNQRYDQLRTMAGQMPVPPARPELHQPNNWQMLGAGLGAIFSPDHAFDILSTPLAWGLQDQERRYQDLQNQYQGKMARWQQVYGLTHEQAQVMAQRELTHYEASARAMESSITRDFEARKFNAESVNRWNEKVADMKNEISKLSIQQTTQLAHEALKASLDPSAPPIMRAKAALFVEALTGTKFDAFIGETPQNQQMMLDNSLKDIEYQFKSRDYPLQLQGRQIQNQHTFLENQQLGINNRYLDEKNRKELQKLDAEITNLGSQSSDRDQRLRNYLSGGVNADRIQSGLRQWSESRQKLTDDINRMQLQMEGLVEGKGGLRDQAEKLVPGKGLNFGWDRAKAVEQKIEELKAGSPAYQELNSSLAKTKTASEEADQQIKRLQGTWDEIGRPTLDGSDLGAKYEGHSDYRWGASGAGGSFDCSSFTQCVYKDQGVKIPRTAQEQYDASTAVSPSDLRPGDLVFFHDNQSDRTVNVHHVGIFIGYDDQGRPLMRHASSAKDGVITVDLQKYSSGKRMQLLGIRRPKALGDK